MNRSKPVLSKSQVRLPLPLSKMPMLSARVRFSFFKDKFESRHLYGLSFYVVYSLKKLGSDWGGKNFA